MMYTKKYPDQVKPTRYSSPPYRFAWPLLLCLSLTLSVYAQEQLVYAEDSAETSHIFTFATHPKLKRQAIGKQELSLVFSGRRRTWSNTDVPIQLILLPSDSAEMVWLSKQLKMPEHLVRRFIYRRVYQGTMRSPIEVNNTEEAIQALRMNPGAIAPLKLDKARQTSLSESSSKAMISIVKVKP